ncbi:MAG: hypothetical protein JO262_08785 [Solirubrobacterales bacterium]|nr:hypothetical protein [Solirubrobacterales bacterium]
MRFRPSREEQQAAQITRLVDDQGADTSSSQAGAWGEQPEIRRQVAAQRRVAQELRTGGPDVPADLVSTVEAKVRQAYGRQPARPGRIALSWRPAVAVVGLAAVCAAIVIAAVGVGGGGRPSIPAAAELAFAPSTGPAPAARSATYLDASYGGVTYPNYQKFSVPPTGTRTDRIGGRPALTVFYRLPNGTRLSYTVFSGKAVPLPAVTKSVVFEGVPLKTFTTSSGLSVVTLVRYGRTCVLAAKVKPDVVLGLAAAPVLAQPTV